MSSIWRRVRTPSFSASCERASRNRRYRSTASRTRTSSRAGTCTWRVCPPSDADRYFDECNSPCAHRHEGLPQVRARVPRNPRIKGPRSSRMGSRSRRAFSWISRSWRRIRLGSSAIGVRVAEPDTRVNIYQRARLPPHPPLGNAACQILKRRRYLPQLAEPLVVRGEAASAHRAH